MIDIDREFCCFVFEVSECESNFLNQCDQKLAEANRLQIHKQFDPQCENLELKCSEGIIEDSIDESKINNLIYIPLFVLMAILIITVFYIVIGTLTHSHYNDGNNFHTEFICRNDNKPHTIVEKVQAQRPPSLTTLKFDMNDSISKSKSGLAKTSRN